MCHDMRHTGVRLTWQSCDTGLPNMVWQTFINITAQQSVKLGKTCHRFRLKHCANSRFSGKWCTVFCLSSPLGWWDMLTHNISLLSLQTQLSRSRNRQLPGLGRVLTTASCTFHCKQPYQVSERSHQASTRRVSTSCFHRTGGMLLHDSSPTEFHMIV